MPFFSAHVTRVVVAIVVLVSLGVGTLIALAFARRWLREAYFRRLDGLRARYRPTVAALLNGQLDFTRGLAELEGAAGGDREYMLEQLCLENPPLPAQVPILGRLCEELGLVTHWQRQLTGQFDAASLGKVLTHPDGLFQWVGRLRFVIRARAAEHLGKIRHQPSWPLLLKSLDDPHTDVQEVALRSLGAVGETGSFPALVRRLHDVVLDPSTGLSLRSIKAAVVSFPLSCAPHLLPSLRHEHRRIRFLATDIIREMVERARGGSEDITLSPTNFSAELAQVFLTELCLDGNADVRARSASMLAALSDPRAVPALLALLEDSEWFVRLHAVRALARQRFVLQAPRLAARLTDPHWMVREAAARALLDLGLAGTQQLFAHFLESSDRYSKEQIADVMQRAGIIPSLLTRYAQTENGHEARVIAQLATMGKTNYLVALLREDAENGLARKFLQEFGRHPDPVIRQWVTQLAARASTPELRSLAKKQAAPAAKEMAA